MVVNYIFIILFNDQVYIINRNKYKMKIYDYNFREKQKSKLSSLSHVDGIGIFLRATFFRFLLFKKIMTY